MTAHLTLIAVVAANVLGGAMAIPQVISIYRTRNVAGVSAAWATASAAVNAWWAIYGIGIKDASIVPVSIFSVTVYLLIAAALVRYRHGQRMAVTSQLLAGSAVGLVPLPVAMGLGWEWTGFTLGMLYAVQLSPAVVTVYRTHDVSGVSVGTWVMAWSEALLWGVYALPQREVGLITLATTGLIMSTLVLVRLYIKRPRRLGAASMVLAR